jgi:GMC oxidoreductase
METTKAFTLLVRQRRSSYQLGKGLFVRFLADIAHQRLLSALKSPQILELSGIGRREVLQKINVPVVLELEGVGENAQDHVIAGVSFRS